MAPWYAELFLSDRVLTRQKKKTRGKKTQLDKYLREVPPAISPKLPHGLHFTSKFEDEICRCNHPEDHENAVPVSSSGPNSFRLEVIANQMLEKYQVDSVELGDFPRGLHYPDKSSKQVVCRCEKPNSHNRVHFGGAKIWAPVQNQQVASQAMKWFHDHPWAQDCRRKDLKDSSKAAERAHVAYAVENSGFGLNRSATAPPQSLRREPVHNVGSGRNPSPFSRPQDNPYVSAHNAVNHQPLTSDPRVQYFRCPDPHPPLQRPPTREARPKKPKKLNLDPEVQQYPRTPDYDSKDFNPFPKWQRAHVPQPESKVQNLGYGPRPDFEAYRPMTAAAAVPRVNPNPHAQQSNYRDPGLNYEKYRPKTAVPKESPNPYAREYEAHRPVTATPKANSNPYAQQSTSRAMWNELTDSAGEADEDWNLEVVKNKSKASIHFRPRDSMRNTTMAWKDLGRTTSPKNNQVPEKHHGTVSPRKYHIVTLEEEEPVVSPRKHLFATVADAPDEQTNEIPGSFPPDMDETSRSEVFRNHPQEELKAQVSHSHIPESPRMVNLNERLSQLSFGVPHEQNDNYAKTVQTESFSNIAEDSFTFDEPQNNKRFSLRMEPRPVQGSTKRVSTMFSEKDPPTYLPDQQVFLEEYVTPCSRSHLAVPSTGDCVICQLAFQLETDRTLCMFACKHYIHHRCLTLWFRLQDQHQGTCPVCGIHLCERKLVDRIDTDREALFGNQITPFRNDREIRIGFPEHGQHVYCKSEEELAATQLRVLKDFVDMMARDTWLQWRPQNGEPDWYKMVRVVHDAFCIDRKLPLPYCRYFPSDRKFILLVIWCELVRLMANARIAAQETEDEVDVAFPVLRRLLAKQIEQKREFDREKGRLPKDVTGKIYCERIAEDAFVLSQKTLPADV